MIDIDKVMKQLNNGKEYNYSSEHFNVRIKTKKPNKINARFQIKGTDLSYTYEMPKYEFDEVILGEDDIEAFVDSFVKKFNRDLYKEVLKRN